MIYFLCSHISLTFCNRFRQFLSIVLFVTTFKIMFETFQPKITFLILYLKGFIFQKVFFSLDEHEAKKIISVNIMKQDFARNIIHSFCSESVLGTGRASTGNIGLGGWIEISVHQRRGGRGHTLHFTVNFDTWQSGT